MKSGMKSGMKVGYYLGERGEVAERKEVEDAKCEFQRQQMLERVGRAQLADLHRSLHEIPNSRG